MLRLELPKELRLELGLLMPELVPVRVEGENVLRGLEVEPMREEEPKLPELLPDGVVERLAVVRVLLPVLPKRSLALNPLSEWRLLLPPLP